MALREEVQKRVEKKQEEIRELELRVREAHAYIQGLTEMMRLLPKESGGQKVNPEHVLRPGSAVARAREAIKKAGKPLHITELLKALGMTVDTKNRLSLSGSISGYVRAGDIFTRPAPNTFGLIELDSKNGAPHLEPPPDFGVLEEESTEAATDTFQNFTADEDVPF